MGPIGKNLSEERTVEDKCLYNITSIFNLHGQESSFERRYIYIYRSLSEDESISEMERRKRREIDGRSVLLRVLILVSRDVIINTKYERTSSINPSNRTLTTS